MQRTKDNPISANTKCTGLKTILSQQTLNEED